MNREYFRFWANFLEMGMLLQNDHDKVQFYESIAKYALNDEIPEFDSVVAEGFFVAVKSTLDKGISVIERGKKGGAPKGNQNAKKQPKTTKKQPKTTEVEDEVEVEVEVEDEVEDEVEVENRRLPKGSKKETCVSIIDAYTDNPELKEALNGYVEMRKKERSFTTRALKLNLNKLDELGLGDSIKIDIVNQSVERGWKSFFPLETKKKEEKNLREELLF